MRYTSLNIARKFLFGQNIPEGIREPKIKRISQNKQYIYVTNNFREYGKDLFPYRINNHFLMN